MAIPAALTRRQAAFGVACLCCAPVTPGFASGADLMTEVAAGIFVRAGRTEDATAQNQDAIANIGFIIGRDGVAVFDPGGSLADGHALLLAIRRRTRLPVRYVVLSHVHPDHIFGSGAFAGERADIIGHARLPAALAARGAYYQRALGAILGSGRSGPVPIPTILVHGQLSLDLGDRPLVLTAHGPAHTGCDLSLFDARTQTLFTGDLVFVNRAPSLDGDLKGWRAELASMQASPALHAVPGHGPGMVAWPQGAASTALYLKLLEQDTRAAVAKLVPIERAAAQVAQSERGKWQMFEEYHPRNVLEAYRELEWE